MSADPLDELIEAAANISYRDLPAPLIEHHKRRIADNIGCMAAGAWAAGTSELLDVLSGGPDTGCLVVGRSNRLPPREAAMQNSLAARALDFCDVIAPGYHPSSTDVPTALALAAHCGSTGREILEALAVAQDVTCRIGAAAVPEGATFAGFDGNVLAPLSGALVAGKLLKLPVRRLREAVGLAANCAAGSFQAVQDKVLAVRFCQAYATRNGIEAALLAERGITGITRLLGGNLSFSQLFCGRAIDTPVLLKDLGRSWLGPDRTCFKMYPSCGVTLALTDAVLSLVREFAIEPQRVNTVRVRASRTMMLLCGQRFEPGDSPEVGAMFSIQYVVANALLRQRSTLADFVKAAVLEPGVLDLAARVQVLHEPAYLHHDECDIEITMDGGSRRSRHAVNGLGWPQNPPAPHDFESKLSQCFAFAELADAPARSRQVMQLTSALDCEGMTARLLGALEELAWFKRGEERRGAAPRLLA
jgi:aconitate decarboxylase